MSTPGKNRSIMAGLIAPAAPVTETPNEPPSRLSTRMSGLARVTSGDIKEKTLRLVDPARCRIWTRHNRRYDLLTAQNCADLLEGLRSQGVQELPALVRRVTDDPNFDFEVIAGARRHWCVSYLRNVEHRDIKYLVEERDLTDEAAFRLSDVENRSRADLCDYERAVDYLQAVDAYYEGLAQRMADRLEVSKSWLSRFLDLARLPAPIVAAFGDVHVLRVNHARQLKPFLEGGPMTDLVFEEADRLAAQQREHMARNLAPMEASKVVQALQRAAEGKAAAKTAAQPSSARVVTNARGEILFTLERKKGRVVLDIPLDSLSAEAELIEAFRREMARARG